MASDGTPLELLPLQRRQSFVIYLNTSIGSRLEDTSGYLAAINRKNLDLQRLDKYRICERHFISGSPTSLYDRTSPDWLPTVNLGYEASDSCSSTKDRVERYERARERELRRTVQQETEALLPTVTATVADRIVDEELRLIAAEQIETAKQYFKPRVATVCECSGQVKKLEEELAKSQDTIKLLTEQLTTQKQLQGTFTEECLAAASDDFVRCHTALPNFNILRAIFQHVHKMVPAGGITKLSPFQEFMFVLLKLRIDPPLEYLACHLRISTATASRIFIKWLKQMDIRLQDFIIWPERNALQKTMPMCYQASFGKKVAVIIDCFEIFIDRPSSLSAHASTWSNYKHHNTAKALLGITPQGTVSFVSECWGGRDSDKHLTEHCSILRKLLPGDIVLADRGFDIAELVAMMRAQLHIPAFTGGKK
ncbi:uncharacterized protein [Dysidea avara]|uniref:uncharacterized protein n=1 Tax=Dysidea avara TaxID=196820 RepID=UPI0033200DC3